MSGQPQNYQHHFLRKMLVKDARGIAFQPLGADAKMPIYTENVTEDAKAQESKFSRDIKVENAKGVEWKATGGQGNTFRYFEKVEFKK